MAWLPTKDDDNKDFIICSEKYEVEILTMLKEPMVFQYWKIQYPVVLRLSIEFSVLKTLVSFYRFEKTKTPSSFGVIVSIRYHLPAHERRGVVLSRGCAKFNTSGSITAIVQCCYRSGARLCMLLRFLFGTFEMFPSSLLRLGWSQLFSGFIRFSNLLCQKGCSLFHDIIAHVLKPSFLFQPSFAQNRLDFTVSKDFDLLIRQRSLDSISIIAQSITIAFIAILILSSSNVAAYEMSSLKRLEVSLSCSLIQFVQSHLPTVKCQTYHGDGRNAS